MNAGRQGVLLGGGIGSGKSTAAACLARLGARVIDTDAVARDVLAPGTPQTDAVITRWSEAGDASGGIDRRALARIVFADPEQLVELEGIVHPAVRSFIAAEVERVSGDVVVVEIPLLRDLVGSGWPWIVVDAPDEERVRRAVGRGPFTESEVRQVMERQATRGEWLAAATWVIDNSGTAGTLEDQCGRVWEELRRSTFDVRHSTGP